jgi:hypothetical protein
MGHFTIVVVASHPRFGILSAPVSIQQRAHMFIAPYNPLSHRSITIPHRTTDTSAA